MRQIFTSFSNFKKGIMLFMIAMPFASKAQILFFQNFESSTSVSSYIGTGTNQLDTIGVSAPSGSNLVYTSGGRIFIQRYGGTGAISKLNISPTNIPFMRVKFKLNVPFNSTGTGTAANFYVGSGLSNRTSTTGDPASSAGRHSQFGVGFGSSGTYYLRKLNNFANGDSLTGNQQITWFINNSGAQATYLNPAGGMTVIENDSSQVWVGTNLYFSNMVAPNPGVDLRDFKFVFNNTSGLGGGISIDDLEISTGTVALPVSLKNFNANLAGNQNQLTWSTASEINIRGFYVQRQASSGVDWEDLGFVTANNKESSYTFKDNNPLAKSLYRLRIVDVDGKETFSKTLLLNKKLSSQILLSPNPTTDRVIVNLNHIDLDGGNIKAVLTDLNGKQLKMINTISSTFELNVSDLPKGMYLLNIQSKNKVYSEKIVRL